MESKRVKQGNLYPLMDFIPSMVSINHWHTITILLLIHRSFYMGIRVSVTAGI